MVGKDKNSPRNHSKPLPLKKPVYETLWKNPEVGKNKEAGGSRQKLRVATPRDLEFREPFLLLSVTL